MRCYELNDISFPTCRVIFERAFYECSRLSLATFPLCTSVGPYAFRSCVSLETISFPKCFTIDSFAFAGCQKMETVSFPECTQIGRSAFYDCSSLSLMYLLGPQFCSLSYRANEIFSGTLLMDSQVGRIYVPRSLYASYFGDANWRDVAWSLVPVD